MKIMKWDQKLPVQKGPDKKITWGGFVGVERKYTEEEVVQTMTDNKCGRWRAYDILNEATRKARAESNPKIDDSEDGKMVDAKEFSH